MREAFGLVFANWPLMRLDSIHVLAGDKHLAAFNAGISVQIHEARADLPAEAHQFGCESLDD